MDVMNKRLKTLENPPLIRKTTDEDDDLNAIDRLSNLPTTLLGHILSFLPTEEAIATSVLSSKWRNVFCLIPNLKLNLYDTLLPNPQNASVVSLAKFMSFLDRFLSITSPLHVLSIQLLALNFRIISHGKQIGDWVGSALRHNLNTLDLRVSFLTNPNDLFNALYGCRLVNLIICLEDISVNDCEYRFSLPSLRTLGVHETEFEIVNGLVEGSPLLENLVVINCYANYTRNLRIKTPLLKGLRIINRWANFRDGLELDAPNLEHFFYSGYLDNRYLLKKLESPLTAQLDVCGNGTQSPQKSRELAIKLLSACSDVQKLWLSELFVMALNALPNLPQFPNLLWLSLAKMDYTAWGVMVKLLECSPNLRSVTVKEGLPSECCGTTVFLEDSISVQLSQGRNGLFVLSIRRPVDADLAIAAPLHSMQ